MENNQIKIYQYWKLNKNISSLKSTDELFEEVNFLLRNSIKMHGRSEVPVGTFLSGGLDSSLVTALFSEHTNNEINTFTMDFEGKSDNEGNLAKLF